MTSDPLEPLEESLYKSCPNGHPDFIKLSLNEIRLHDAKNHDYAAGGNPLGNFNRVAGILKFYPDFPSDTPVGVMIIYALKQLDAVMWGLSQNIAHRVEGYEPRLGDLSVYAKLMICALRDAQRAAERE